MPEYVYALHDFTPENPDEVPFKAGDKIEVIEKDDMYGDGWWQVSTDLHSTLVNPGSAWDLCDLGGLWPLLTCMLLCDCLLQPSVVMRSILRHIPPNNFTRA